MFLAGGALALGLAPGHGSGPAVVKRDVVPLVDQREVGADQVEVELLAAVILRGADVGGLDEGERVALPDDVADHDGQLGDDPADVGLEDVLHLHGVHDDHLLARDDGVALGHEDLDDRALDRRADRLGASRADDLGRVSDRLTRLEPAIDIERRGVGALTEEVERGERVLGLIRDLRTGPRPLLAVGTGAVDRCRRELADPIVDPAGVDVAGDELGVREDVAQERQVGVGAAEFEFGQRAARAAHRVVEVAARRAGDHLRDQ